MAVDSGDFDVGADAQSSTGGPEPLARSKSKRHGGEALDLHPEDGSTNTTRPFERDLRVSC